MAQADLQILELCPNEFMISLNFDLYLILRYITK
jgi:hypothetical protein